MPGRGEGGCRCFGFDWRITFHIVDKLRWKWTGRSNLELNSTGFKTIFTKRFSTFVCYCSVQIWRVHIFTATEAWENRVGYETSFILSHTLSKRYTSKTWVLCKIKTAFFCECSLVSFKSWLSFDTCLTRFDKFCLLSLKDRKKNIY